MPNIPLTEDERAAVADAIRRLIAEDKYPHAPRLDALRAALAKLDAEAPSSLSENQPEVPQPGAKGGHRRRLTTPSATRAGKKRT
jgi:hypothetical protein